jgi:hypothetical protein
MPLAEHIAYISKGGGHATKCHAGPREAPGLGQEAEAGKKGKPRPEPLLGCLWERQGRAGSTAWDSGQVCTLWQAVGSGISGLVCGSDVRGVMLDYERCTPQKVVSCSELARSGRNSLSLGL